MCEERKVHVLEGEAKERANKRSACLYACACVLVCARIPVRLFF